MNEVRNPFEDAVGASELGNISDPFAPANTISENPLPGAAPPANLSNERSASPFELPSETSAATQSAAKAATTVIDLGSQPGIAPPVFADAEEAVHPAKEISGAQLTEPYHIQADAAAEAGAQPDTGEIQNPLSAAMDELDKTNNQSIFSKPPIFEHGAIKEPIENQDQTFEDLRVAKADDFPELEDEKRVSWTVTYGKVTKAVPIPKKTKIREFKKSIEASKEFMDALKKDKNKNPDCVIKPRVTAQVKGEKMPVYKGIFTDMEQAQASDKPICIVPGRDGKVYEIRREEMGTFTTPAGQCKELSDIRAGFTPALPPIPRKILLDIIDFFRSLTSDAESYEAIVNIYWDRRQEGFVAVIPKQRVTAINAESELSDDYNPERYLHYMDVHSHNVMPAQFSAQDDHDEKATRLYSVIGTLDKPIPEMSVRISNGGKHLLIGPADVFETSSDYFPVQRNLQKLNTATADSLARLITTVFGYEEAMCA